MGPASARPTTVTTTQASECLSPKLPDTWGYSYVIVRECGADFKEAAATLTSPQKLPKVDRHPILPGHAIGEIAITHSTHTVPGICDKNAIEAGWIVGSGGPSWNPFATEPGQNQIFCVQNECPAGENALYQAMRLT